MKKLLSLSIVLGTLLAFAGCGTYQRNATVIGYSWGTAMDGLIFPTYRTYIKSSPESTDQSLACIESEKMFNEVEKLQERGAKIKFKYHTEFFTAPWRCSGEGYIINSVEEIAI